MTLRVTLDNYCYLAFTLASSLILKSYNLSHLWHIQVTYDKR